MPKMTNQTQTEGPLKSVTTQLIPNMHNKAIRKNHGQANKIIRLKSEQFNETKKYENGFSMTEILVVAVVIGIISSIALPNFFSQLCRSRASEAEATISSLMAIIASFSDETGTSATSWDNMNSIGAVMTATGTAKGDFSNSITLPSKNYTVSVTEPPQGSFLYSLEAEPKQDCENWQIRACLDLSTGASDIQKGNGKSPAKAPVCT